ncbi:uncharacterized protein osm [Cyprinus carpio]|uniref:Uncharacterized protein osm n=1 Tax=Cyprinus carpio TaxID=7962 RepID=A0A9Q9W9U0_CYPCA|nr:uncharacterized protein osm [Cyprinus carpio]
MELKTGLLIWWILMMIQAMTCRPAKECNFIERINYTKFRMEALLNQFLSANENDIRPWPKPISELHLKNLSHKEKMQKAQCGLHFMQKALQLIQQHQSELHDSMNPIHEEIRKTVDFVLERTKLCVAEHIGHCTNIPEPDFQFKEIYKRKQWGRTVLETSLDFLDELVKIPNHASSRRLKP